MTCNVELGRCGEAVTSKLCRMALQLVFKMKSHANHIDFCPIVYDQSSARLVRFEPVVPCHVSVIDHVMTSCVLVLVIVSSLRTEYLMSCFGKLMQVTCFVNDCVPVQGARLLEARR